MGLDTIVFDTIVFDFGNVLLGWEPRLAFDRPAAEVDWFFDHFDFMGFNRCQDAGRSIAEGRAAVAASQPEFLPWIDEYIAGYPKTLSGPIPGTVELVTELKAAGYRLYGLTNWWGELYHFAQATTPAIDLMDRVMVSGRVGLAKPDPAIYALLCEQFDVDPQRAVFIDDSAANVAAAREFGFHAVQFTDLPGLRADLDRLGIAADGSRRASGSDQVGT